MKRAIVIVLFMFHGLATTATAKCKCDKSIACLTDKQMAEYVKHLEMEPDRFGSHTNASGVVTFEVVFGTDGQVVNVKAISGHALAIPLLMGAASKWQFKPYLQNGVAQKACGTLALNFSIVENVSNVQVERSRQKVRRVRIPTYLAESMTRSIVLPHDIGIPGNVVLEVLVEKNGRVLKVRGMSGDPLLVRAARPAIMKWVFSPYFIDGEPVQFLTELPIQFDGKKRSTKAKNDSDPLTTR